MRRLAFARASSSPTSTRRSSSLFESFLSFLSANKVLVVKAVVVVFLSSPFVGFLFTKTSSFPLVSGAVVFLSFSSSPPKSKISSFSSSFASFASPSSLIFFFPSFSSCSCSCSCSSSECCCSAFFSFFFFKKFVSLFSIPPSSSSSSSSSTSSSSSSSSFEKEEGSSFSSPFSPSFCRCFSIFLPLSPPEERGQLIFFPSAISDDPDVSGFFALVILFTLTIHSAPKPFTRRVNLESPFFKFNCHGFVLSNLSKRSCNDRGQLDQKSCGTDNLLLILFFLVFFPFKDAPLPLLVVEEEAFAPRSGKATTLTFFSALLRSLVRSTHLSKNCSTVSFTNTVAFGTTVVVVVVVVVVGLGPPPPNGRDVGEDDVPAENRIRLFFNCASSSFCCCPPAAPRKELTSSTISTMTVPATTPFVIARFVCLFFKQREKKKKLRREGAR